VYHTDREYSTQYNMQVEDVQSLVKESLNLAQHKSWKLPRNW